MVSASSVITPAPLYGAQRGSAHAEQVGKGDDHGDDGEAQAKACEGHGGILRDTADVNAIHDVVEHIDQLGQGHGQGKVQNVFDDASLGKVVLGVWVCGRRHGWYRLIWI